MQTIQAIASRYSYSSSAAPEPLLGMTLGQIVDAMAEIRGEGVYITDVPGGISLTFKQFKERVDAVACSLIALGVKKGDRVAMLGMNSADWVVIQFAAPSIGAWFVNLNAAFPEEQLGRMIKHSDPFVIFSQSHYAKSNYFEMLGNLHPGKQAKGQSCPDLSRDRILVAMDGTLAPDGFMDWSSFIECGRSVKPETLQEHKDAVDIDDISMICYTGGTSGVLKAALRTHLASVTSPLKSIVAHELDFDSVICLTFLLFHTAGMNGGSTLAMVAGARLVIPNPSFDATATLRALSEEGCTHYSGVPTTIKALLDHPDFDPAQLKIKTATIGGGGGSMELLERAQREMGVSLCTGYGGTEPGTLTMTVATDPDEKHVNTVGRVACHTEVKIIDPETGRIVLRGTQGEVCVRSPSVMKGYYKAPELTAKVLDSNNWYHTGDVGVMDNEGYLKIIGRIDDMIIRGGENVQPVDVENVLRQYRGVEDAQVVGVPDQKLGHEIAAWLVANEPLDKQGLREHCKVELAYYQVPRWFFRIDEFPQTGAGKIDRRKLVQLAIDRIRSE